MSVNVTESAALSISGITTTGGVGLTLLATPTLSITGATRGDYFAETFVVNPSTVSVKQEMGYIVTGNTLWIQTDIPVTVTLNQGTLLTPINHTFTVDTFLFMNATFVEIYLTNSSATTAANINLVVVGDRTVNAGAPGIY